MIHPKHALIYEIVPKNLLLTSFSDGAIRYLLNFLYTLVLIPWKIAMQKTQAIRAISYFSEFKLNDFI